MGGGGAAVERVERRIYIYTLLRFITEDLLLLPPRGEEEGGGMVLPNTVVHSCEKPLAASLYAHRCVGGYSPTHYSIYILYLYYDDDDSPRRDET